MRKSPFFLMMVLLHAIPLCAQQKTETQNVILITLDGFRWQELFRGAELEILGNPKFVKDSGAVKEFGIGNENQRRANLLPFFWTTIATQGQLYGNRALKNYVDCANPYWFSYPGYHEMLVGAVDRKIRSNGKIVNPNETVFDFVNQTVGYKNRVGAFSTWDVFPYILRESITGIPVNSGLEASNGDFISDNEILLNEIQIKKKKRIDSVTFQLAFEYLKRDRPRLLFIALDETDEHGHGGRYDKYLMAAHQTDSWISDLWSWVQSQPDYKDKTTLLISTDHGRGRNAHKNWRSHGRHIFGSNEIWMAALGPDTPANGEMKDSHLYQAQLAKTIAAFLGEEYQNKFPVAGIIHSMIMPVNLIAEAKSEVVAEVDQKK